MFESGACYSVAAPSLSSAAFHWNMSFVDGFLNRQITVAGPSKLHPIMKLCKHSQIPGCRLVADSTGAFGSQIRISRKIARSRQAKVLLLRPTPGWRHHLCRLRTPYNCEPHVRPSSAARFGSEWRAQNRRLEWLERHRGGPLSSLLDTAVCRGLPL